MADYLPLVRHIANRVHERLPSHVDIDDLVSVGVIGLLDAIDKYDPGRQNKFKTYAEFRIRGAILDELRSGDWLPRSARDDLKAIERSKHQLTIQLGRTPTDREVADELNLSLEDYFQRLARLSVGEVASLDEMNGTRTQEPLRLLEILENEDSDDPFAVIASERMRKVVQSAIVELPEKMQIILRLHYIEGLKFQEIAKIIEMHNSRVSQLHFEALKKLKYRAKLKELVDDAS